MYGGARAEYDVELRVTSTRVDACVVGKRETEWEWSSVAAFTGRIILLWFYPVTVSLWIASERLRHPSVRCGVPVTDGLCICTGNGFSPTSSHALRKTRPVVGVVVVDGGKRTRKKK